MPHLTLESIARLVDEPASAEEAAHLEACAACRSEVEDMRGDAAALAALPPLDPPAGDWDTIEARLRREGLIRSPAVRAFSWRSGLLRLAAAIVIFLLGTMSGVAWVRAEGAPMVAAADDERPLNLRPAGDPSPVWQSEPATQPEAGRPRSPDPDVRPEVQLASSLISARQPRNAEEAALLTREVEALYYEMLSRLAETAPVAESGDPLTRLAVLEGITTITGTALGQAPADPILNGYHLAALAQREATLKQIAARTTNSWF
jgi:hypothetical protein